MSELTEIVRGGFDSDGSYLGNPEYLLKLCTEVERLEDLLAAWVSLPRAGNQSMPAELRALYDAGMGVVAKRKAVWPGAGEAKEVERG